MRVVSELSIWVRVMVGDVAVDGYVRATTRFTLVLPVARSSSLTPFSLFAKIRGVERKLTIAWAFRAIRDMRRIAPRDRDRIIAKIEQYAEDPTSLTNQVITLTGGKYRRLRVGNHQVIFNIERDETSMMIILIVRHRREVYD